ncbi:hypothetical protein ACFSUD_17230 [Sulfitobacter aestuarii]|uniref:Uncharacterized protein n=1 Tax=Sulfitobacter aestuarii TaxID=2161676 RepID=A0ABW5U8P8_9RHOB
MLTVTQSDLCRALRAHRNTISARLADVPNDGGRPKRYALYRVLPLVKWRESFGLPATFAAAKNDGEDHYIGGDVSAAHALVDWLDPVMKGRAYRAQTAFSEGLAASQSTSVLFADIESLRLTILTSDAVLPYVVLGDESSLPDWASFSPLFALANAPQITPTSNQITEKKEEYVY